MFHAVADFANFIARVMLGLVIGLFLGSVLAAGLPVYA